MSDLSEISKSFRKGKKKVNPRDKTTPQGDVVLDAVKKAIANLFAKKKSKPKQVKE